MCAPISESPSNMNAMSISLSYSIFYADNLPRDGVHQLLPQPDPLRHDVQELQMWLLSGTQCSFYPVQTQIGHFADFLLDILVGLPVQ